MAVIGSVLPRDGALLMLVVVLVLLMGLEQHLSHRRRGAEKIAKIERGPREIGQVVDLFLADHVQETRGD